MITDAIKRLFRLKAGPATRTFDDDLDRKISEAKALITECEGILKLKSPHPMAVYWAKTDMKEAAIRLKLLEDRADARKRDKAARIAKSVKPADQSGSRYDPQANPAKVRKDEVMPLGATPPHFW